VRLRALIALPLCALAVSAPAAAADARIAAVQVALHARGLYGGPVDGIAGPATRRGVARLQRRAGITVDGIAGPQTLAVLGGNAALGARVLSRGTRGLDVAALQFALAEQGFPSGNFDGIFGSHTDAALRRFQRFARLAVDGRAGPATAAALAAPAPRCPTALHRPLDAPVGDRFGPRGSRFHSGVDLPAPAGTGIAAAGPGRVAWAAWLGAYGKLVVVAHGGGVRTFYAHLSVIEVRLGQRIAAGYEVGRVGATGHATGPHLHFEVRLRGAAVDPLGCL
jgi:murein DD-endopeptidase MepM/ murein hydrolase activator NlpD